MIFEDAHWTDPTSLEAFGRTVDQIKHPSSAAHRHVPPRVRRRRGLGRSHVTSPGAQPARGARNGRHHRRALSATRQLPSDVIGGDRGAHGRHSAVRRGDDEGGARGGQRGRGPAHRCGGSISHLGGPCKFAGIVDGAARPARPSQGTRTDWSGYRARVLACISDGGDEQDGSGTSTGPRPSIDGRIVVPAGRFHHTRSMCLNTHWYGTRPTAHCCASRDARCTPPSPICSKSNFPRLLRTSLKSWHGTSPRPGGQNAQSSSGSKRGGALPDVRLTRRQSRISSKDWSCWFC